jgi:hypothetical protein
MRRWCVGIFITAYLTALTGGLACQTLRVGLSSHPGMYFILWDMYCGWAAYNSKYRAIAEGVSGTCYDLNPAPWGTFKPYDTQDRYQYSTATGWMAKAAAHTVAHTQHEPIAQIFVIEETWAKQFDLPDYVWKTRYNIPMQKYTYSSVRIQMDGTGAVVQAYPNWVEVQRQTMAGDNPRLQQNIRNTKPFWIVDEHGTEGNRYFQDEQSDSMSVIPSLSAPSAN